MLIVGLTGGIGSGKTTVAEVFSKLGIPVYFADTRAKELMHESELMHQIIETFGKESYVDGELNRPLLAKTVFNDESRLKDLNAIVHPAVRKDHKKWHDAQSGPYTLREAAILFESGSYKDCDKVITVSAPEALRVERVVARDGAEQEAVLSRIRNQWSEEERQEKADYVITNDGKTMLLPQVLELHKELLLLSKKK